MPFIDDEELTSLQKQIDVSIEQKEDAEEELEELKETLQGQKKKGLITNIIFGVLAGLGLGAAAFFFFNGGGATNIDEVKIAERQRILDSLDIDLETFGEEADADESEEDDDGTRDAEGAAEDVKDALQDQKVYSVQVKAMTNNEYPAMSTALAGLVTEADYFKYSIGIFNTVEEAHELRKSLVKIGFRDAFVASYVNGERQEIHKPGEN